MANIPFVNYRFGDLHRITSFIDPDIDWLSPLEGDALVEEVAKFIRTCFTYPTLGEYPSADGQLLRCHKNLLQYCFKECRYYVWSFPQECLHQRIGICVDTANLGASLLIAKLPIRVCLGEVRSSKTSELLGLHAWVLVPYKNDWYFWEATIHTDADVKTLILGADAENKVSTWAQSGGVYYVTKASYNREDFEGDPSIVGLMSFPAKIMVLGFDKVSHQSPRKLKREWQIDEMMKVKMLLKAFQG